MSKGRFRALLVVATLPLLLVASAAHARSIEIQDDPKPECTEHCVILDKLVLRGDARKNTVKFVLTGQVLAPGPQIIRLFGSPATIGLTEAKLNGGAATIGFEEDAWYLRTAEKRFTLTGVLVLGEETGVSVKGPVNVVDASMAGGYVSEGNHFTGATDLAVTFEKGEKPKEDESPAPTERTPAKYEIARFIDAGETTTFEYQVTFPEGPRRESLMLPLLNGESIKEVTGATYSVWELDGGGGVTLHPIGAEPITIRGTLSYRATFAVDAAGQEQMVVVHADADHELTSDGNATFIGAGHGPFADRGRLLSLRTFRVQAGQKLVLTAKKREGRDVFAAVVDQHTRTAVWSASGELVTLDRLAYDNTALDTLRLYTTARPIFLAIDGVPERMSRREASPSDVLEIPLRLGRHDVKVEALDHQQVRWLGGRLALPMPSHGLTESSATVSLGLPAGVHPVMTTGGDERERFLVTTRHVIGFGLALLVSLLVFARARSRALATFAGFGAFVLAPGLFAGSAALAVGLMLVRSNHGRLPLGTRAVATVGGVFLSLALAGVAFRVASEGGAAKQPLASADSANLPTVEGGREDAARQTWPPAAMQQMLDSNALNEAGALQSSLLATAGGVLPVELRLPQTARAVTIRRTLVTRERPFAPTLYYVTDAFFWILGALWLGSVAGLAWIHRVSLLRARTKLRELLVPPIAVIHNTPMPPHPPYRSAHPDT